MPETRASPIHKLFIAAFLLLPQLHELAVSQPHKSLSAHYSLCSLLQFILLATAYFMDGSLTTVYINCGE